MEIDTRGTQSTVSHHKLLEEFKMDILSDYEVIVFKMLINSYPRDLLIY